MKNTNQTADCKQCKAAMAGLLLDAGYAAAHPGLAAHLQACAACRTELAGLQATFALLDDWTVPEPSPYFDSKMRVRLREAELAAPEGLWERLSSFLKFSTGRRLRPAMTGTLAAALLLAGGGTFIGVYPSNHTVQVSPTVNDLKILDNNAQALQQMDQLLDDPGSGTDDAPPTT
jgi:hypothetical protein